MSFLPIWTILLISAVELVFFVLLLGFFRRLKKSEQMLLKLQQGQKTLLHNLNRNAELEQELVTSFAERQTELQSLDQALQHKADALRLLLEQAEKMSRSPQLLRELILTGHRKGRTPPQLAKATGLSLDEVELILAEAER